MGNRFDIDMASNIRHLFLAVREILLSHPDITEVKKANITSYFSPEGGICYLKTQGETLVMGLFKGVYLEDRYGLFNGNAKIIRHIYFKTIEEIDRRKIDSIINDAFIYNIQNEEFNRIKRIISKK